jgi:hypothetical protein
MLLCHTSSMQHANSGQVLHNNSTPLLRQCSMQPSHIHSRPLLQRSTPLLRHGSWQPGGSCYLVTQGSMQQRGCVPQQSHVSMQHVGVQPQQQQQEGTALLCQVSLHRAVGTQQQQVLQQQQGAALLRQDSIKSYNSTKQDDASSPLLRDSGSQLLFEATMPLQRQSSASMPSKAGNTLFARRRMFKPLIKNTALKVSAEVGRWVCDS